MSDSMKSLINEAITQYLGESTRAELAIETKPGVWTHVYVHYDGSPNKMLPALKAHSPEEILKAGEIRSITTREIEAFKDARKPRVDDEPILRDGSYLYVYRNGKWKLEKKP